VLVAALSVDFLGLFPAEGIVNIDTMFSRMTSDRMHPPTRNDLGPRLCRIKANLRPTAQMALDERPTDTSHDRCEWATAPRTPKNAERITMPPKSPGWSVRRIDGPTVSPPARCEVTLQNGDSAAHMPHNSVAGLALARTPQSPEPPQQSHRWSQAESTRWVGADTAPSPRTWCLVSAPRSTIGSATGASFDRGQKAQTESDQLEQLRTQLLHEERRRVRAESLVQELESRAVSVEPAKDPRRDLSYGSDVETVDLEDSWAGQADTGGLCELPVRRELGSSKSGGALENRSMEVEVRNHEETRACLCESERKVEEQASQLRQWSSEIRSRRSETEALGQRLRATEEQLKDQARQLASHAFEATAKDRELSELRQLRSSLEKTCSFLTSQIQGQAGEIEMKRAAVEGLEAHVAQMEQRAVLQATEMQQQASEMLLTRVNHGMLWSELNSSRERSTRQATDLERQAGELRSRNSKCNVLRNELRNVEEQILNMSCAAETQVQSMTNQIDLQVAELDAEIEASARDFAAMSSRLHDELQCEETDLGEDIPEAEPTLESVQQTRERCWIGGVEAQILSGSKLVVSREEITRLVSAKEIAEKASREARLEVEDCLQKVRNLDAMEAQVKQFQVTRRANERELEHLRGQNEELMLAMTQCHSHLEALRLENEGLRNTVMVYEAELGRVTERKKHPEQRGRKELDHKIKDDKRSRRGSLEIRSEQHLGSSSSLNGSVREPLAEALSFPNRGHEARTPKSASAASLNLTPKRTPRSAYRSLRSSA